jgi:transposase-like protein
MDEAENDVLAYMEFPAAHRSKLHSTNGLERLNKEVKRRADVVGIFPNEASIIRLVGAVLMEANDEWQLQHRYLSIEALAEFATGDDADKFALAPPAAAPILTPRAA